MDEQQSVGCRVIKRDFVEDRHSADLLAKVLGILTSSGKDQAHQIGYSQEAWETASDPSTLLEVSV